MGIPAHVQPDGGVGRLCHREDSAKQDLVAHDRVCDGLGHQGHAETAGHQADQGVDLRGLRFRPFVSMTVLAILRVALSPD